jgi:putative transposase
MLERVIRTLKEQCTHRRCFKTLQHASRAIGDWIYFYHHQRPYHVPEIKIPAETYVIAQIPPSY